MFGTRLRRELVAGVQHSRYESKQAWGTPRNLRESRPKRRCRGQLLALSLPSRMLLYGCLVCQPRVLPAAIALTVASGLPNIRFRLPSRNWCIFLGVVGSWSAAVYYDRREKKRIQKKWCTLVEDVSREPLATNVMARKLTVYLAAPPGDGLGSGREHFFEYVKPVLAAASMDWDVIEGRREGEVRTGTAEKIRRFRQLQGEVGQTPLEIDKALAVAAVRERSGTQEWPGIPGDLVIGRHTWKEYVRGLHEGWLGPLDAPAEVSKEDEASKSSAPDTETAATPASESATTPEAAASADEQSAAGESKPEEEKKDESKPDEEKKEEEKPKKKPVLKPAFINPHGYDSRPIAPSTPQKLGPSAPIPFPHILGFRHTPVRMWRFLNQRHIAEDVGRQVAAAVLATHRPFQSPSEGQEWEQKMALAHEERNWLPKFVVKTDEGEERPWVDEVKLDPRIAERMQRFELSVEQDDRAKLINEGKWVSKIQSEQQE